MYVASRDVMAAVAGFDIHRGVVAAADRRADPGIDAVLRDAADGRRPRRPQRPGEPRGDHPIGARGLGADALGARPPLCRPLLPPGHQGLDGRGAVPPRHQGRRLAGRARGSPSRRLHGRCDDAGRRGSVAVRVATAGAGRTAVRLRGPGALVGGAQRAPTSDSGSRSGSTSTRSTWGTPPRSPWLRQRGAAEGGSKAGRPKTSRTSGSNESSGAHG